MPYEIKKITSKNQETIVAAVRDHWGDEKIIVHEEIFNTADLPGFLAMENNELLGYLHYQVRDDHCEILTLASLRQRQGIGTALVDAVEALARKRGCKKLTVTTTNDNLAALVFYQQLGFRMSGVGLGLVDDARLFKSSIPEKGNHDIPIHDEIYLEKTLSKNDVPG